VGVVVALLTGVPRVEMSRERFDILAARSLHLLLFSCMLSRRFSEMRGGHQFFHCHVLFVLEAPIYGVGNFEYCTVSDAFVWPFLQATYYFTNTGVLSIFVLGPRLY
jgi:hypothetical protein